MKEREHHTTYKASPGARLLARRGKCLASDGGQARGIFVNTHGRGDTSRIYGGRDSSLKDITEAAAEEDQISSSTRQIYAACTLELDEQRARVVYLDKDERAVV